MTKDDSLAAIDEKTMGIEEHAQSLDSGRGSDIEDRSAFWRGNDWLIWHIDEVRHDFDETRDAGSAVHVCHGIRNR
jgi:hypothetical protein